MAAAATPDPTQAQPGDILLIDGPLAGTLFPDAGRGPIRYDDPGSPDWGQPGTYHVHKCQIAGRAVMLGSVRPALGDADVTAAFWEHLATPLAAAISIPRPV